MSGKTSGKFDAFAGLDPEPKESRPARSDLAHVDRAAERQGFGRRDAAEIAVKRQRGTEKTVHQFTMRVAVASSNKFVLWCEKHRLSYREGFDRVVELLDRLEP